MLFYHNGCAFTFLAIESNMLSRDNVCSFIRPRISMYIVHRNESQKKKFTDKPIQTSNIEGCLNLCVCIVRQILE